MIKLVDIISRQHHIGINALLKIEGDFLYATAGPCFEYQTSRVILLNYQDENLIDTKIKNSPDDFSEAYYFGYEINLGTKFSVTDKLQFFTELSMSQVVSKKHAVTNYRSGYFNMNLGVGLNYSL